MLTSKQNPKVKYFSSLRNKKKRGEEGRFIIEGIHLVEEALSKGLLERAIYGKNLLKTSEGSALFSRMIKANIPIEEASDNIVRYLSDVETPQGIIASVKPRMSDLGSLFDVDDPLIVVACGIQDPGNLGTIIRTASAAGCSGLILTKGTADPYNEKSIRASTGSIFHLNMVKIDDIITLIPSLKRRGIKVVSGFTDAPKTYFEADYRGPTAIVIGSEGQGLPRELLGLSDESVSIPMSGNTESLNAAISAAVILYEALRQRRTSAGEH
jgi:TrmH family RNA methyltransferase